MSELSNEEIREVCRQAALTGSVSPGTMERMLTTLADVPRLRHTVRAEYMPPVIVRRVEPELPIPMLLWCPVCSSRHLDVGEFATKPHHTHACQDCGSVWRPAVVYTVGVLYLPGYKNEQGTVAEVVGKFVQDWDLVSLLSMSGMNGSQIRNTFDQLIRRLEKLVDTSGLRGPEKE